MVKTTLVVTNPSHPYGAGEALKLRDNVHVVLKNKAYVSGIASGYCANGGYLEYIVLTDGKRRVLVYGKDIIEITVLPMKKEEKERKR